MRIIKDKKVKAFTLTEVVLYLGLFGFIFTSIISYFFVTDEFNKRDIRQVEISKNAVFIVEHLDETFTRAKSIDVANSIFDNNVGTLSIIRSDNSTIRYSLSNNRIIALTTSSNFISGKDMIISVFRFERIVDNGITVGVRFILNISSSKTASATRNVTYTYVLK